MASLTSTAGIALLCYIVYRITYSFYRSQQIVRLARAKGCEEPLRVSGPWPGSLLYGWRRLRRMSEVVKSGGDILDDFFGELFTKATTVKARQFDGSVDLLTIEPANIQAMLATQFEDFEIGQQRINTLHPLLKESIFSSDGSAWEHSRALFRPQFNRENINDLETTEETCKALISAIGPVDADGWSAPVDLQPLMFNFTLDTATAFLFGESVNSLSAGTGTGHETGHEASTKQFLQDFELCSHYMILRIRLQSLYWIVDGLKFRRALRRIQKFTERFVRKALASPAAEEKEATAAKEEKKGQGRAKYNLLSALARETQNRTELRNQIMAILLAGRDTTASLLGWSLLRLSLHPALITHLRNTLPPRSQPLSFSTLKSHRPLQSFLSETLRLHPTVPLNTRRARSDTTLPSGGGPTGEAPIAVPEGTTIAYSVYLMQRRKDLWGEDAEEFRPERWEGEERKKRPIRPWMFLPFSGGPRVCLGQQFALTEASYVLVRLLQTFDAIEPVDREEMAKMTKGLGLTMWPADGVKVRLHSATLEKSKRGK